LQPIAARRPLKGERSADPVVAAYAIAVRFHGETSGLLKIDTRVPDSRRLLRNRGDSGASIDGAIGDNRKSTGC
jgi:hypothetical protein